MKGFQTQLEVIDHGGDFELLAPLVYVRDSGEMVIVYAGFCTDFASIPQFIQNIFPRVGKYDAAAVLHDWAYRKGGRIRAVPYTRAGADALFYEAMGVLGVGQPRRWLMWLGVRLFGGSSFQQ